QRVMSPNPAIRMPPRYAHKDLTGEQKDTIRRWVAEGAVYEGHWSYQEVKRAAPPQLSSVHPPVENPIDNFIQSRLEKAQLQPSPEADRRTLIRRVTMDLTGLLPSPAEVLAFENDRSPTAYEKLVDRLLASPRYAEQRAINWLDAVHYADSAGYHGDNLVPTWPYRDYVLNAFRDNKPFDQFTREQIAGDLMPGATLEQKVASAYNRLNRTSAEGGIQPKEYLAKYGADRVRTVSIVWLGSTMGCAECHDHKFDPFLTKDFYSMKAFFADIDETGLVPDRGDNAWGKQIELPTADQKQRRDALDAQIAAAKSQLEARAQQIPPLAEQQKLLYSRWQSGQLAWRFQRPEAARSLQGSTLTIYNDEPVSSLVYTGGELLPERKPGNGLVVASGKNPDNETYVVTLHPGQGVWTSLGLGVEQDDSLPGNRIARGADRFLLTGVEATLEEPGRAPSRLRFSLATGDQSTQNGMPAMAVLDDNPNTGWGVQLGESTLPFLALRFAGKVTTGPETRITVRLRHDSMDYRRAVIGRFRLALSSGEYSWPADASLAGRVKNQPAEKSWAGGIPLPALDALKEALGLHENVAKNETALDPKPIEQARQAAEKQRAANQQSLRDYLTWASPELTALHQRLETLQADRNVLQASIAHVVTTVATAPRETRILPRGNWMDDTAPIVEGAIPEMFGKLETGGRRATRLDLANWLVSPRNPLTARAVVNRTWREFFGTGLSKTLDDLGSQGEWPTHPELLDWLASEFMHPEWDAAGTHDWDMRHLIRTIVLSHTYRQASTATALMDAKDPENRLLARQSRFRIDAENVRDIALEVSGLLKDRFGGPSVYPYQPDGYLATLNFPKREYSASRGDDLYRRGLYTSWRRTFLHPALLNFDAPSREECTVNRVPSNTPLQALDLLNDPTFVEAARVFAEHASSQGGRTVAQRIDWIFRQSLNRPPDAQEERILADLYKANLQRFKAAPSDARKLVATGDAPVAKSGDPAQLGALTMVTRAVLSLHEFITRN
ncbi:MAG TPA: hypothetical protein DEQ47_07135, partial [Solibacterales bacterium]|nr:hypothetical protein [Bryobacterales bacterium]